MPDGPESTVVTWAPGRVNLIGEHTDYSGGLVLPIAIQYGITLDVVGGADAITLTSSGYGDAQTFAADGSGPSADGWARYAQAVAAELASLGRPPVGIIGELSSNLTPGSGLSSAAVEVAVALALCAAAGFELEPLELALACQRAELRAVGVPCGILDQAACLLGRAGSALLLDCGSLEHRWVPLPDDMALLVLDSGERHSLEHSGYGDRRRELEAGDPRRVRHVETENERVREAVAALERGDVHALGPIFAASQVS